MKTEQAILEPQREEGHSVSRALQELAPLSCQVVESSGKRVPLSSAGYVLRIGGKYRVRVVLPFEPKEVVTLQVIAKPDFINVDAEILDHDEAGRAIRSIPFRVQGDFGLSLMKLGALVRSDEIEMAFQFQAGSGKYAPSYSCPIVVRPGWYLILFGGILSILTLVVPALASDFFFNLHSGERGFWEKLEVFTSESIWWILTPGIFGLFLCIYFFNMYQVYRRAKELRQVFRENKALPMS